MTPAVFLDRDGTLIEEVGYLDRTERIELYPWTVDAVRLLNRAGLRVVVVTNQAGVARGIFEERFVGEAHRYLDERLAVAGARIDGYYYCPHHPDAPLEAYRRHCDCRKPRPGMVQRAADELQLDVQRSFVVGDRWSDVQIAHAVGAHGVLVKTGYGESEARHPREDVTPSAIVRDLMAAVVWILERHEGLESSRHG